MGLLPRPDRWSHSFFEISIFFRNFVVMTKTRHRAEAAVRPFRFEIDELCRLLPTACLFSKIRFTPSQKYLLSAYVPNG
ncbi:hypothetical protein MEA186_11401 [Mesorhizobium amorphae CCNWGS0123]|uniref:Uncharacterized protein n=1 Tax=Mesorhizobium amorphae CCNWGS0123 TaxID=1082933 RepID=G6Y8L3_9HYPH|nr:hypothetical protein A6B35_25095 [Mesorhizobium amorphae CCNWGS0123]EHH11915.1 hypothetical protein MEA186_11401 [Mesorhizobium amorphae CCNWGS0123]